MDQDVRRTSFQLKLSSSVKNAKCTMNPTMSGEDKIMAPKSQSGLKSFCPTFECQQNRETQMFWFSLPTGWIRQDKWSSQKMSKNRQEHTEIIMKSWAECWVIFRLVGWDVSHDGTSRLRIPTLTLMIIPHSQHSNWLLPQLLYYRWGQWSSNLFRWTIQNCHPSVLFSTLGGGRRGVAVTALFVCSSSSSHEKSFFPYQFHYFYLNCNNWEICWATMNLVFKADTSWQMYTSLMWSFSSMKCSCHPPRR